jgi:hypothetical protein
VILAKIAHLLVLETDFIVMHGKRKWFRERQKKGNAAGRTARAGIIAHVWMAMAASA